MRPAAHLPAREKLPFAPQQIHFSPTSSSTVGPTTVGFSIYRDYRGKSAERHGWSLVSRLTQVRKDGTVRRALRTKEGSLDPILSGKARSTGAGTFRVSARSAFYRVDAEIENESGRRVHYWNYYRVLRRHWNLKLALSATRIRAGESLHWRFENFGTTAVSYGLPYRIERFDETSGAWRLDSMTPSGFPSVGLSLGAGQAGDCQSLVLPAETSTGRYRLSKEAVIGTGTHRFGSDFEVTH
jgi:hypothetical protein